MDKSNEVLLKCNLEVAVPLWIEVFKDYDEKQRRQVMKDSEEVLYDCAEGISHKIEGKSEKAFNALAKAIAALSFVPGGIKIFGLHFETKI